MRRLACLLVAPWLLGCPLFEGDATTTPSPAATAQTPPASPAPSSPSPASRPAAAPASRPAPPLLLDLKPGVSAEREGVSVTVERLRLQPCTAEALQAEPSDLSSQAAEGSYYLSLLLTVSREGTAFFELAGEEGELSLRAFALVQGEHARVFPAGFVSELPDRPEAVYVWRVLEPPAASAAPLILRVVLESDDGAEVEFEFELAR